MNLHLVEISAIVAPGAHAVLTIDGAGWHQTGGRLRVPGNITLLHLPPYSPELNPTENVWAYLRGNKPGAHGVVVMDGAGWHRQGGYLKVPGNLSLLILPPYSPELNPQDNVWQHLRQNSLTNRVFDTYDASMHACCHAWNSLIAMPERISSIAARN